MSVELGTHQQRLTPGEVSGKPFKKFENLQHHLCPLQLIVRWFVHFFPLRCLQFGAVVHVFTKHGSRFLLVSHYSTNAGINFLYLICLSIKEKITTNKIPTIDFHL